MNGSVNCISSILINERVIDFSDPTSSAIPPMRRLLGPDDASYDTNESDAENQQPPRALLVGGFEHCTQSEGHNHDGEDDSRSASTEKVSEQINAMLNECLVLGDEDDMVTRLLSMRARR